MSTKTTPKPAAAPSSVSFHLTNCSAKDARFLSDIIRFFTDPAQQTLLRMILENRAGIYRAPSSGAAVVIPTFHQN